MKIALQLLASTVFSIVFFGLCCSGRPARSTTGRLGLSSRCSSSARWSRASTWPSTYPDALQTSECGPGRARRRGWCRSSSTSASCVAVVAIGVVSAVDFRFGWSTVPTAVVVVGNVLVAGGLGIAELVVIQNSYAAANITVEADQPVVSTGLYGVVRHPMYVGDVDDGRHSARARLVLGAALR